MVEGRTMQNAHMDVGARVKQEARADAYTDVSGRVTQDAIADDCKDAGGRAKQEARAEQSAIRHKQYKHPGKYKGWPMLEGVVPLFQTYDSGLRVA